MFLFANFLTAVAQILNTVLSIYSFILIVYCVISWVNPDPYNPIVQFLRAVTEPLLMRIRRYVPPLGPLDMSVIAAFLLIMFLRYFVVQSLFDMARVMR